jgi:hypothetical protein
MSATLGPIAGRLASFMRLLSSDKEGEVVAAVRAITRTLRVAQLDIHTLAEVVEGQPANVQKFFTEADAKEIYFRGIEDGRRQAEKVQGEPIFHSVGEPSWYEIACECAARPMYGYREKEFVEDMKRRLVHGVEPPEKQAIWLRKIYGRRR